MDSRIMNELPYIPLSTPLLSGRERDYVIDCIDTAWISSVGKYVTDFERKFADYVKAPGAVACSCGTAALHLALIAAGVKSGDAVFVPSLTFIAPVNAIAYVGATPIFIDSEEDSFGLSPASLELYIAENCSFKGGVLTDRRSGRRISAMLPVHLMGRSCDIYKLMAIASEYGLTLLEDAAEGIGTMHKGRHVGAFGLFGCFSFNGNKTLTTGGGGMIVSSDTSLLRRVKHLSTQAKSDELLFEHDETGYNYRMNNIQAALGVGQLEHLDSMLARKREVHGIYEARMASMKRLKLIPSVEGSACWMAVLKTPSLEARDLCVKHFDSLKIQARPFWALNHTHPMYRECPRAELPVAEALQRTCVSIPCSAKMNGEEVDRVVSAATSFDSGLLA
jgi:perosamine synthetase